MAAIIIPSRRWRSRTRLPRRARTSAALLFLSSLMVGAVCAQQNSDCRVGTDTTYLDINSTRATLYNNGLLFDYEYYEYPKDSGISYLGVNGLWISGFVNGEHRIVSSNFSGTEFAPGPLAEDGLPVSNCRDYNRITTVSVRDILAYDMLGILTDDLRDWPWQQGAAVIDGDGVPGNYNLAGGDRPRIRGHQEAKWVINDDGIGTRRSTSQDIPVEVDMSAFALASSESYLDNTTLYEYSITNRSEFPLEDTYVGLFYTARITTVYTGVDTTLNMVFRYGENNVPGPDGLPPAALGIDLVQTPLNASGDEELGVSSFVTGYNVNESYLGDGAFRNFLTGHSFTGKPFLDGCVEAGAGEWNCLANASLEPTGIMFPGDPVTRTPVSMINPLGEGTMHWEPSVFLVATGPFVMAPGETQKVTVAITWARGEDFLDSITVLREEDEKVQQAWDSGLFDAPPAPDKPEPITEPLLITPADGATNQARTLNLHWSLVDDALGYVVELDTSPEFADGRKVVVGTSEVPGCLELWKYLCSNWLRAEDLAPGTQFYWRVRTIGSTTIGPPSDVFTFTTTAGDELHYGYTLELSNGQAAFIEVSGPEGSDPCSGDNTQDIGCMEAGGNLVRNDPNSTEDFYIDIGYYSFPSKHAPRDFEIRFSSNEAYAFSSLSKKLIKVPFTAWDIGDVGAFGVNDPSDDEQLMIGLGSSREECQYEYGQRNSGPPLDLGWLDMPSISAFIPQVDYSEFFAFARTAFEGATDECISYDDLSAFYEDSESALTAVFWGNPDGPNFSSGRPADGTIIRFLTTPWSTSTPLLAAPENQAPYVEQPVNLYWNSVTDQWNGLLKHQIEVATSADFREEDVIYSEEGRFEHVVLPPLTAGSDYYWRIRSRHQSWAYSPWSETWHFAAGMQVGAESPEEVPTETHLFQNYPNPFRGSTTLTFTTTESARVSLRVYDVLGREVALILDDTLPAGRHQSVWVPRVASGMYFSVLNVGSIIKAIPLVKVR